MRFKRPGRKTVLLLALSALSLLNATMILRSLGAREIAPTSAGEASAPQRASTQMPSAGALVSVGKVGMLGEKEARSVRTAILFASYYLISTRATATLCKDAGVDLDAFTGRFIAAHDAEYARASRILAPHGLNTELIWSLYGPQLEALSTGHVARIAALDESSLADACARMAGEAGAFAESRRYDARFPELHATLMAE